MADEDKRRQLRELVEASSSTVFFGGAGVSTESGIPDFRSATGLYRQQWDVPPETIISRSFFDAHPEEFFRFYRERMVFPDARPNQAHVKLAELEHGGKLQAVITQNIDGLHQKAGSENVIELHGSIWRNHCMACGREYGLSAVAASAEPVPHCSCGGIVKPDVVLYEEPLDDGVIAAALDAISQAELLIVAGTSLVVYPAAGFLRYFRGSHLVIVNMSPTPADSQADLLIADPVGDVFDW